MKNIKPITGYDYPEAVEIGLWHANDQFEKGGLSQIILIGDSRKRKRIYHKI